MGDGVGGRAFRGSVWLFSSYALSRFGRVAIMLALAAFLSPREYGIIGLSYVIVGGAQLLNECIWPAVVHRSNLDERFLSTAFTMNVLGGVIVALGLFLGAPWIAQFYGDPEITNVLRVLGLGLIPDGIFYVPDGLLRKELNFRSRALPEIAGTCGAGVATITLLLLGVGVVSFAIGFVVENLTRCILTIRIISWRPKLRVSWLYLRQIASYSKHIMGADLARHLSSNIDFLIVGRVLGAGPLGFYTLAFNLANYPVTHFAFVLSRVMFPTFAALQGDLDYARRTYLKVVQIVVALVTPLLVVLALLAPAFIIGLLGEKWQPAIFPLQAMVIAGISRAVSYPGSDMLRAFGYPNVPFKINFVEGLVVSGALLLFASRGIEAVALTVAIILSTIAWITTAATCRTFGISLWELGRALVPGIALAASAAVPMVSLRLLGLSTWPDALEFIVLTIAAGTGAVVCLATVCKNFLRETVALVASAKWRANRGTQDRQKS